MTTIPWLDCCSVTGDTHGFSISPDPSLATVTLQEWQVWLPNSTRHPGRHALSNHSFTLSWHSSLGYIVEVAARLRINAAAAPKSVEFLNYLPPRLMQPWPAGLSTGGWGGSLPSGAPLPPEAGPWPLPRSTLTAWANDTAGGAWLGFSENILAGAELRTYSLPSPLGALGAWGAGSYSPALAYSLQGVPGAAMLQQTCPTWGDQHQVVSFPPSPGPDGYYDLAPTFTSAWLPPPAATYVLDHAQVKHEAGQDGPPYPMQRWLNSTMIRVGVVEDFEGQPLPLTSPVRALAQAWSAPDYGLRTGPGVGRNGSSTALAVQPMTVGAAVQPYSFSNPQPLIPLNASTAYTFSAWVQLPAAGGGGRGQDVAAWLWLGLYEADDFNAGIAQGPTYGRTGGSWNSSTACTLPRCPAGTWAQLVLGPVVTPPWPAYADVRLLATSQAGAGAGEVLVDDWYFGPSV